MNLEKDPELYLKFIRVLHVCLSSISDVLRLSKHKASRELIMKYFNKISLTSAYDSVVALSSKYQNVEFTTIYLSILFRLTEVFDFSAFIPNLDYTQLLTIICQQSTVVSVDVSANRLEIVAFLGLTLKLNKFEVNYILYLVN